jgi:hypothetical protein
VAAVAFALLALLALLGLLARAGATENGVEAGDRGVSELSDAIFHGLVFVFCYDWSYQTHTLHE